MMDELQLLIADAKSKFGEIHRADIEEEFFLFRLLTRKEYKEILLVALDNTDIRDELVCQVAIIYPTGLNFTEAPAGIPGFLSQAIMYESGFNGIQKADHFFEKFRHHMTQFEAQGEAAIQAAFPHISDEMMEDWTVEKFFKTLAKAEWLLKNVHGYPIEFKSLMPDEDEEEPEQEDPPTYRELGDAARKEGIDPMVHYAAHIIKPLPYAEFPFIGGTEYWKKVF